MPPGTGREKWALFYILCRKISLTMDISGGFVSKRLRPGAAPGGLGFRAESCAPGVAHASGILSFLPENPQPAL